MSKRFTFVTVALSAVVAFLVGLIIAGEFTPSTIVADAPRRRGTAAGNRLARREPLGAAVGRELRRRRRADERGGREYRLDVEGERSPGSAAISSAVETGHSDGPSAATSTSPRQGDRAADSSSIAKATSSRTITSSTRRERITVTLADGRTFRARGRRHRSRRSTSRC